MTSQEDLKISTLIKRCRNNGILEYGNDDILSMTQYSRIPSFQYSKDAFAHKVISYQNSHPPGKWFLDRCDIKCLNKTFLGGHKYCGP